MTLTEHQQERFNEIIKDVDDIISNNAWKPNRILSLEGYAGVGKTVITSELVKHFINIGLRIVVTTPTHKSLNVIREMLQVDVETRTIHSYLGLKQKPSNNPNIDYILQKDGSKFIKKVDVLIVDESSMVSNELFTHIEEALENGLFRVVLFVGDSAQLLPVDGEQNPVYANANRYILTEIVRQAANNPLIHIAHRFREVIGKNKIIDVKAIFNEIPLLDTMYVHHSIKDFMQTYLDDKNDKILATYTNKSVNVYNNFIRQFIYQDKNVPYLLVNENIVVEKMVTEGKKVHYNNGEVVKIRTLKESYIDDIAVYIINDVINVVKPEFKELYEDKKRKLKNDAIKDKKKWYLYYNFLETFTEIKHTHSCTIHKLQGSTYDNVYINVEEILRYMTEKNADTIYRLMYVGLTRARQDVHLYLGGKE